MISPSTRRVAGVPDRLPLKEKAWNAVALGVSGDRLTLNGTTVHERVSGPTSLRIFGLFHDPSDRGALSESAEKR
jgi:hypothetical protein